MKKLISLIVLIAFYSQVVLANPNAANCDWKTGIKILPDGNFEYSADCNLKVGLLVQENQTQAQQIQDYQKAIQLKDLALKMSDDRATLWTNTSKDLEDRLQKVDTEEKHNQWLYFSLGVATTFLAAYGASKLIGR